MGVTAGGGTKIAKINYVVPLEYSYSEEQELVTLQKPYYLKKIDQNWN